MRSPAAQPCDRQTAGPETLRRLLAEYDPERRDEAVLAVYKRTLGALEEAWLAAVERGPSGRTALRSFLRHLGPLLRPYWLRQAEVLVYMLFELGYGLALPLGSMVVVDTIIPGGNVELLAAFVVGLLAVYGLDALVGMRRVYVNEWINERILTDLRARMFDHLQRLPHSYYAAAKVGDVMARLFGDLTIVGQALAQLAGVGIFLALRAVVTAIALLVLHPLLGSLVLIVVPLFVLAYLALERRLERTSYDLQNLSGEVEAAAQENLSAHGTIKAFGLERRESESFRARLLAQFRTSLRMSVLGAAFETSTGLAISLGELVVIGAGSYLVMRGELSVGTLLAFIGLLALLFQPIGMLSNVGQTVQKAAGALERVAELLDEPVAIADRPGAAPLCRHTGTIRFDHVTFGYRPDRPILRDLSLAVPAGRHVAIVGPSGAGKSTLVNLLLRFWDPDQGRILLDGQDARDVQLASLRGNIGVVFQDTFVFDSTLRENIAIGRAGASDAEIVAAAKAARLHEYIESLPAGYDTLAGERGVRMSGGQRQRLAIARALLRNPAILIMDEPTSALDARTERELLDTLRAAARDRTTITITHRLSLAAAADHVLVLSDGRLVEQGSHAELVRAGGLYRRLFEEQAGLQDAASVTTRNLKLVERSA